MNLQFVNTRHTQNIPYSTPQNNRIVNIPTMGFSNKYLRVNGRPINNVQPVKTTPEPTTAPTTVPTKGMKWGEPTWFLLHTLAEKIKDDQFVNIRASLLNIIYLICTNLPCPDCSNHAKTYLDGINFNTVQTKTQLKRLLFDFHNTVNKRKGYALFDYAELDEKYSKAVTINIIYNFMHFYNSKSFSIKMIANDIYRNRIIETIKNWFNMNIRCFD